MYKKVFVTPYFGEFPQWFEKYKLHFEQQLRPKGYDWLLDTDLEGFKKRVKDKIGIEYLGLPGGGKVWDFRGSLGLLYEDEIKGYDFWGHTDFDCVYGEVDKWVTDEFLSELDVHSNHGEYVNGPWSLYRNNTVVNTLFFRSDWRKYMTIPEPTGWIEKPYSRTLEESGLRYKYTFWQGNPYTEWPNLKLVDGKLYQDGEEIMTFHFKRSKRWPI
jgi:hypothetical protein